MPVPEHEANRQSWNVATRRHNTHKGDQARFLRDGGSTLFPEEIDLLGDVRGKTLLHLQCNTGVDTLSIASQIGAIVTGVDISDEAVAFAQQLSTDSGIPGTFIRSDLFDWFAENTTQYDVVFTSYGAIGWLSDVDRWGAGIAAALKPGGHFVIVEFHPTGLLFEGEWELTYDYMGGRVIENPQGVGDYVGEQSGSQTNTGTQPEKSDSFNNPHPAYEFPWGLADVVNALLKAGLTLRRLHEYPYANGFQPYPDMRELDGRRFTMPDHLPVLPFMFGILAVKPA